MGRKTIRDEIRKKEAALKHAEATIKELMTAVNAKNHEINKLHELIDGNHILKDELDHQTMENQRIKNELATKKKDLTQKICENEKIGKQIATKEEELKSIRSVVNERNKGIMGLAQMINVMDHELKDKLSEKNLEIAEIKANLMAAKNELLRVRDRTVWQQLKACFLTVKTYKRTLNIFYKTR